VVTNALTHGLAAVGDLFLDAGEEALSSDLMWENYNLSWETRIGARISTYPFFDRRLTGFNQQAFTEALFARRGKKLVVALNFPNNPSGYTPTKAEAGAIVNALVAATEAGSKLVVVCDDAYYGMFFDDACEKEYSGYFMCLRVKGVTAEAVRQKLLEAHGVGVIALGQSEVRVAFSCLSGAQIPGVFKAIAAAVRSLRA